jgi:disulfide oxidoreductase YuzD
MTNSKINKLKNIIQLYTNTENMTNNKLAVEWLAKSYVDLLTKLNNEEISLKEFEIQYIELLEQAKEMQKEEIINAYKRGKYESDKIVMSDSYYAKQYYNETFAGDKQ